MDESPVERSSGDLSASTQTASSPFSNAAIRELVNAGVDRDQIMQTDDKSTEEQKENLAGIITKSASRKDLELDMIRPGDCLFKYFICSNFFCWFKSFLLYFEQ